MKMKKAFTIIICALCCITLLATATPVKAEALSLTSITYRLRTVLNNWTNQLKDRFDNIFSTPEQTPDSDTGDRDDGNADYDDNHENDESEDSNTAGTPIQAAILAEIPALVGTQALTREVVPPQFPPMHSKCWT